MVVVLLVLVERAFVSTLVAWLVVLLRSTYVSTLVAWLARAQTFER